MGRKFLARDFDLVGIPGAIPRTTKKKRTYKKADAPEKQIQDACEAYMDLLGIEYLHIPAFVLNSAFGFGNGRAPGPAMGAMRAAKKYVTGFPDLCIFHPDRKRYLAVELKSSIGTLTALQIEWKQSIDTQICRSFEDFKIIFDAWLNTP